MREVDDRYPEIAKPYEPVKGGKHHKRLDYAKIPLLMAGALIALSALVHKPLPVIPNGPEPEVVVVVPTPSPEPVNPPETTPKPDKKPEPPAPPTPSPTPTTPVPPAPPTPSPSIEPGPTPIPEPEPEPEPEPDPSPSPETETRVRVTITGAQVTQPYTGGELYAEGYTYTARKGKTALDEEDFEVTYNGTDIPVPMVSGTEPGTYYMGLTKGDFSVSSGKYKNINVTVNDGWLKIIDENQAVTVTIVGNHNTLTYTGENLQVDGFTYTAVTSDGDDVTDYINVELNAGSLALADGVDVGTYQMNLRASDFTVTSGSFTNITVQITDGYLEITPQNLTITVTGNTLTVPFDNEEHVISGYTINIPSDATITLDQILGPDDDQASAHGSAVGTYYMNLSASDFSTTNTNYNVTFSVTDGWLKITSSDTHNAPVITIGDYMSVLKQNGVWSCWRNFDIQLNDLAGGSGTLTLYVDGAATDISLNYEGTSTATGTWSDEIQYTFADTSDTNDSKTGKPVLTYKYPDGTTGTVESSEFYLYKGSYITNTSYSYDGRTLTLDIEVDPALADASQLDLEYSWLSVTSGGSSQSYTSPTNTSSSGNHYYVRYNIGAVDNGATFEASVELITPDGSGSYRPSGANISGQLN